MGEFNQDILKVLADAKQPYLELQTPLFLSYSVCFQAWTCVYTKIRIICVPGFKVRLFLS